MWVEESPVGRDGSVRQRTDLKEGGTGSSRVEDGEEVPRQVYEEKGRRKGLMGPYGTRPEEYGSWVDITLSHYITNTNTPPRGRLVTREDPSPTKPK